jgi:hypothetical protein
MTKSHRLGVNKTPSLLIHYYQRFQLFYRTYSVLNESCGIETSASCMVLIWDMIYLIYFNQLIVL